MGPVYNSSPWEVKAGRSEVQGQLLLPSESEVSWAREPVLKGKKCECYYPVFTFFFLLYIILFSLMLEIERRV